MSELKAGDALDFTVSDKTLTLEPVPYGQLKKVLRIVFTASGDIATLQMKALPDLIDKYIPQILPLLFIPGKYPFLDAAWIEDNMTVPTLRKMIEAAIVINGLQDFFAKPAGKTTTVNGNQPTPETLAGSTGSTTSAGSPTDGDPKTSTS